MPPISLAFLKCATINVRGLSQRKFSLVSDFFRASRLDFCFIQETMISNDAVLRSFSSSWPLLSGGEGGGGGSYLMF